MNPANASDFVRLKFMAIVLVAVALDPLGLGAPPPAKHFCSGLMNDAALAAPPDSTITTAAIVSGTFAAPRGAAAIQGLPSFCRVTATLKPSPVSDIKIEVWLPVEGWNGKIEGVGNGGLAGTISYSALAAGIRRGYASVSTDTGHIASDVTWLPIEERERDYGYRAIHGMTVVAKAVVQEFYGSPARRSYFNGCSTGGGQGLGEAQLYPEDYDAILAGAPSSLPTSLRAAVIWEFQAASNNPAGNLSEESLSLITETVLEQCGGKYGPTDGFLSDPRTCKFSPAKLLCKIGQDPATCLTAPQVSAVNKIYAGTFNSRTKELLWPGLMPGSEEPGGPGTVGWQRAKINGPVPFGAGAQFYSYAVYENPNLDFHTMDMDHSVELAEKKFPFINHNGTDIEAFLKRGGKLLMYHGWADPLISPLNSINYYGSLVETVGRDRNLDRSAALEETQQYVRLFMVPGMGHCAGGPGPDTFDGVGALDDWAASGAAPEKIIASHVTNGVTTFSRPLCPYPQEAAYKGAGDRKDAANWVCIAHPFTYDSSFYGGR